MKRFATIASLAALLAGPAFAQASEGQQSATVPALEGPDPIDDTAAIEERLGDGNHTFADDFQVGSKIVTGSETGLVPQDGMIELERPVITMNGWRDVTRTSSLDTLLEDAIPLYSEQGEQIGEVEEFYGNDAEQVVVALGGILGVFENRTTVRSEDLTLMQNDTEVRAYVAASQEMLEAQPEIGNGNALVPVRDTDG